jgi:hypothetical protein
MKKILPTLLAGLAICSCAPTTPQARIEKNPAMFAALGKKEQELVRQGQLSAGMSPDAVTLAWGPPDQRFEGSKNGKHTERWDYAGSRPVYSSNYFGGFGYGFGGYGYGRYGYSGLGWGLGPQVEYIPYRVASVWFTNHRVESWERLR